MPLWPFITREILDMYCTFTVEHVRHRQNLEPPSGPLFGPPSKSLNFYSEKKNNNKLKLYTIRVLHTTTSFTV